MTEHEHLMNNGSPELAQELAASVTPEDLAQRVIRLEAGFALIMQAYDDLNGDLRRAVASTVWALFPAPKSQLSSLRALGEANGTPVSNEFVMSHWNEWACGHLNKTKPE